MKGELAVKGGVNLMELLRRLQFQLKQMGITAARNDFAGVVDQALDGDVICIRNDRRLHGRGVVMISEETLLRIAEPAAKPRMLGDVLRALPSWGTVVKNVALRSPEDGTEKLEMPVRQRRAEPA